MSSKLIFLIYLFYDKIPLSRGKNWPAGSLRLQTKAVQKYFRRNWIHICIQKFHRASKNINQSIQIEDNLDLRQYLIDSAIISKPDFVIMTIPRKSQKRASIAGQGFDRGSEIQQGFSKFSSPSISWILYGQSSVTQLKFVENIQSDAF